MLLQSLTTKIDLTKVNSTSSSMRMDNLSAALTRDYHANFPPISRPISLNPSPRDRPSRSFDEQTILNIVRNPAPSPPELADSVSSWAAESDCTASNMILNDLPDDEQYHQ